MDEYLFRRFQKKYSVLSNGCWQWRGATTGRGYGVMKVMVGSRLAHRLSYEHYIGPIAPNFTVDHLCRNTACVNPNHLEMVSNKENNMRGGSAAAMNVRKTHCPAGHEYTPENTYVDSIGSRHCRSCHRIREYQRKQSRRSKA